MFDDKKYDKNKKIGRSCSLLPRKPVNALGIVGAGTDTIQLVLDSIHDKKIDTFRVWQHPHEYAAEETDPLRFGKMRLLRQAHTPRWMNSAGGGLFRVVIGPDLVAEKQAGKK